MKYTLIRARKRTLSLQVTSSGQIIARAPLLLPKFFIDQFVRTKSAWIEKKLADLQKPQKRANRNFTDEALKKYIKGEVKKYSLRMSLKPTGLRFTQVKSYWGTCAPSGLLSFNLALAYAPPSAVSYVVVHELTHLKWKGHGHRFWAMVEKYYPQTKQMRQLLRSIPRF